MQDSEQLAFHQDTDKPRKNYISEDTWQLIKTKNQKLIVAQNTQGQDHEDAQQEIRTLKHKITKAAREDRNNQAEKWISEQQTTKEQWQGIQRIKNHIRRKKLKSRTSKEKPSQ